MIYILIIMILCSIKTLPCFAELNNQTQNNSDTQQTTQTLSPTQQPPIIVIQPNSPHVTIHHPKPDSFHGSLAASVLPGIVIGATNGFAWHLIDKTLLGPKLCWLLWPVEFTTRKIIESKVLQLMQEHHVKHNAGLLITSAWLTDWITYLLAWKLVHI